MSGRAALRAWRATVRLAWDLCAGAPLPLAAALLLRVLNAARPGLATFITAGFINGLVQGHGAPGWAAAFAAVHVAELLTDAFSAPAQEWLRSAAALRVQHRVLACAAGVPFARLQDPDFHDRLARAGTDLDERLARWLDSVLHLVHAAVAAAGLVFAIFALGGGPALAGVIALGSVAGLLTSLPVARLQLDLSRRLARPRRLAETWAGLLSGRAGAPEIRLFGLQAWIGARWAEAYRTCARERLRCARRELCWNSLGAAAAVSVYAAILLLALAAARQAGPARAAGVFASLLLTVQAMQWYCRTLLTAAGHLHEHAGLIGDLAGLFAEPAQPDSRPPAGLEPPAPVAVEGVTFRYPAAPSDSLRGATARVAPGEVIALVGPNGAGKSTLAALLLGLYQPARGTVRAGHAETGGGPRGSAVFQDFARYALPVRDNVGFGDLARHGDDAALRGALGLAGSHLAAELDTWLGAEFGGRDLSGGEWLRVAIARGLVRRSGLIVLDEPTAAIDPVAEVELIRRLVALGKGRTAVVVSHRLGIARLADRILVMDQGQVVEQGTHAQLLAAAGLYARMWRVQAAWYA